MNIQLQTKEEALIMVGVNLQEKITSGPNQATEVLTESQGLHKIVFHHWMDFII